jgi:hypothetical protein
MESTTTGPADPPRTSLALGPFSSLVLALIAAGIVFGIIQSAHPVFLVPEEFHAAMGAAPEVWEANRRETNKVHRHHAMLYVGSIGLLLGLTLGLGEAALRRSVLPPLFAVPLGGLGGALGGLLGCFIYEHVHVGVGQAELSHTITAQFLLGAPLGLGVGLGLGLATRTIRGTLLAALGGIAAALLAAIVYPVAVSIVLPNASTDALLPVERSNQILWLALLCSLIGLCIPTAGRQRKNRTAEAGS